MLFASTIKQETIAQPDHPLDDIVVGEKALRKDLVVWRVYGGPVEMYPLCDDWSKSAVLVFNENLCKWEKGGSDLILSQLWASARSAVLDTG